MRSKLARCAPFLLALAGCSGGGVTEITVFEPAVALKVFAGDPVPIAYRILTASGSATADVYADVDGDLATAADRVTLQLGRDVDDALTEDLDWDTAGVTPARYRIFVVLHEDGNDMVEEAPGTVAVADFSFSGFGATRMVMQGEPITIAYADNCPVGVGRTDLYADRDGDLATAADRFTIAVARPDSDGAVQSLAWDTTGIPPAEYFIIAVFSEDAQILATLVTPNKIVVNAVAEVIPADGAQLLGTAANTRVRFALPLVNATVDAATMPVSIGTTAVAGQYTIENGNRDVVFTPDSCFFPAPVTVRLEVKSSVGEILGPATSIVTTTFDTAPSRVYCGSSDQGRISIVDPVGLAEVGTVPLLATDDVFFATASSRGLVLFGTRANTSDGGVIVFDAAANGVLGRVAIVESLPANGTTVAGLALSPDEDLLYAAVFEGAGSQDAASIASLAIIDVATRTQTGRVVLSRLGRVRNLAITADGSRAFVPNLDASVVHVIDLATRAEIDTDGNAGNGVTPFPTSMAHPSAAALSGDGTRLYVAHSGARKGSTPDLSVFDTATFAEVGMLASSAFAGSAGAPVLRRNVCDGLLYAPRTNVGPGGTSALSVFDPSVPDEAILDVSSQGYYRDVAFVWGTTRAALADHDGGNVQMFDTSALAGGATAVATSIANLTTVTTLPPLRP